MASNIVFCELCACYQKGSPCVKCEQLEFQCEGTCVCCKSYRIKSRRKQSTSAASSSRNDASFCKFCACDVNKWSCAKCVKLGFHCKGTCLCCEDSRSRSPIEPSNSHKDDDRYCKDCDCADEDDLCDVCFNMEFTCPGTCDCCHTHRQLKNIVEIVSEVKGKNKNPIGMKPAQACSKQLDDFKPAGRCKECLCNETMCPCLECVKMYFNCPGTCICCKSRRKGKDLKRTSSKES